MGEGDQAAPRPERIGPFAIVGTLGRGGMGVVYRAVDSRLGRAVALKVLPPDAFQDRQRRERFLREARAAAAVLDPGIATVFEVGEHDGVIWLAMELVEGRTLREVMRDGRMPAAQVRRLAARLAEAVGRAHRAGVVHRDLKP